MIQDNATNYYPICVVPPERHYDSCQELVSDIRWFEESRAYFYKEHPEWQPPRGKFEKVRLAGKKGNILLPTSLDYGVLYRGQGQYYGRCLPTLYRQELTDDQLFVEEVRIAEFRLFLEQYEITKRFEASDYIVDYVGLAQHYGLKTDVLDLTSDIDIAMFFAMCDYDRATDMYKPKEEDREYVGYIYAILSYDSVSKNPFGVFSNRIQVIGLQPFERPGKQRGYAYHVGCDGLVSGYLYSFCYTKDDSLKIYNHFHKGQDLWHEDEISITAKEIAATNTISGEAIRLASRMFGAKTSINKRLKSLRQMGYHITSRRKMPWASLTKRLTDEQWHKVLDDVIARKYISEGKERPCIDTRLIGQSLMKNYMYGSVDSPFGYDSGLQFMEETDRPVFGLVGDMHRDSLVPEGDGKIHAKWYEDGIVAPRTRSFRVPDSFMARPVRVPPV